MLCAMCGQSLAEGATSCPYCGAPRGSEGAAPGAGAETVAGCAGFWWRFLAFLIDFAIVLIAMAALLGYVLFPIAFRLGANIKESDTSLVIALLWYLIAFLGNWLYCALMESSGWQSTLGKRALGIKVTNLQGKRITFGRATGRHFAKIVSSIILGIGFLMVGFTKKKQGLHDMIASCLVVRP